MISKIVNPKGTHSTIVSEVPLEIGSIMMMDNIKSKIIKLTLYSRKVKMYYYDAIVVKDIVKIDGASDSQNEKISKAKEYLKTVDIGNGKTLFDVTKFEIKKGKIKTKRDQYKQNNWSKLKKKIK